MAARVAVAKEAAARAAAKVVVVRATEVQAAEPIAVAAGSTRMGMALATQGRMMAAKMEA